MERKVFDITNIVLSSVRKVILGARKVAFTLMYALESLDHLIGPACKISISVRGCEKSYSQCEYRSTWCESGFFDPLII